VANSDLSFAFELVDLAVDVSMKAFRRADLVVETKVDGSPVTEVDRRVEGALRDAAARYHPSDRVVGEEFGGEPGRGRCWFGAWLGELGWPIGAAQ
jgi:histidinol-phosphatase